MQGYGIVVIIIVVVLLVEVLVGQYNIMVATKDHLMFVFSLSYVGLHSNSRFSDSLDSSPDGVNSSGDNGPQGLGIVQGPRVYSEHQGLGKVQGQLTLDYSGPQGLALLQETVIT